ncbi:MAG: lactonase family protein [Akkermansiaceae bacterium]|nr:lactonase family protein [Akkermansiaceae bacterium]
MKALLILAVLVSGAMAESVRVYIGTGKDGIYTAMLDRETGKLSEPVMAAEVSGAGFLAVLPGRKLLFATARPEKKSRQAGGSVTAWKIRDHGKLDRINQQPSEGSGPCHVSVDATGNTLLVANYGSGSVAALKIDEDGSLVKSASAHQHEGSSVNERRQSGPHAHSFYPGPNNKFAYAPDLGMDKVMIYALDPEQAGLAEAGFAKVPPGSGPRHMKFGKDGKQAYVLNELLLTISVFDLDAATGMFKEKQLVDTIEDGIDRDGLSCSEIRVHPSGKFIYAAIRDLKDAGRNSVAVFKVLDGGKLERIQRIDAEIKIPRNINLDPRGEWLLVAGQRSNEVSVFKVDPGTGKLSFSGHKVSVPGPMCIEFL